MTNIAFSKHHLQRVKWFSNVPPPKSDLVANVEKNYTFRWGVERSKRKKTRQAQDCKQAEKAKLTCDAAKVYDQSDETILKGEGWKIIFRTNDESLMVRYNEMKFVKEEKITKGVTTDNAALRKAYAVVFPTDEALCEKIGLAICAKPKTFVEEARIYQHPANSLAPEWARFQANYEAPHRQLNVLTSKLQILNCTVIVLDSI